MLYYSHSKEIPCEYRGKTGKEEKMNEEMNVGELLKETAEENQTRKILEILEQCQTLEEAKEKVRALLKH